MHEKIKAQRIIYFALFAGMVIFALLSVMKVNGISTQMKDAPLTIVAVLLLLGTYFFGNKFYQKKLGEISPNLDVNQKLALFQTASIIRWASMEGAVLFCIILMQINTSIYPACLGFIGILVYLSYFPNQTVMENGMQLNSEEKRMLFGSKLFE
ncbi:hypothetical protein [Luteibaculum oceani]|uniref:Uncharacterized protein n=1 Tax=Luteibaculum oceani TaxID=1294296 RepID=A0A5C6V0I1_9FLAO|nr:hypothetical protein [Luteibaculum oceani]TXC78689.1 hypothetical protein FRX97_08195 [Luteibaculum oceani]